MSCVSLTPSYTYLVQGFITPCDVYDRLLDINTVPTYRIIVCSHLPIQLIESDIQAHQDQVDDIMAQVRAFREAGHFQIDQIEDRGRELVAKSVSVCLRMYMYALSLSSSIKHAILCC